MSQSIRWFVSRLLAAAAVAQANSAAAQVLAFPGAEGYGRFARGGRGGDVYHVTSLDDAGPGSLREAIASAQGPRTIVFDVSGTIELKSRLRMDKSFMTLAGQTAPGDGIAIKDHTFQIADATDVIVRYMRFRLGDRNKPKGGYDTLNVSRVRNLILDHITASWGVDGNMDTEYTSAFTLQWSVFAEALHDSIHEKGPHAMLASFRKLEGNLSIHHNLLASCRNRHPTLGGSPETQAEAVADFRNNVVYNWEGPTNLGNCCVNVVANYYRPGPNTGPNAIPFEIKAERAEVARGYLAGNDIEGHPDWTADNGGAVNYTREPGLAYKSTTRAQFEASAPFVAEADAPVTHAPAQAYELVLEHAGASLRRDAADRRLVAGVRDRTHRRIDSQEQVGGWPPLAGAPAPPDTDRDGMPDAWERARSLDAGDPEDRNGDRDGDGYTNLEEYINSLCPGFSGADR